MIAGIELVTGAKGVFDVELDGELLFSKKAQGRHATPGEVVALVRERLGSELHWS